MSKEIDEKAIWDNIQIEKKMEAATYLNKLIPKETHDELAEFLNKQTKDWPPFFHMGFGMGVRNGLRQGEFGEEYFGIENLDFIYIELLKMAVYKIVKWEE